MATWSTLTANFPSLATQDVGNPQGEFRNTGAQSLTSPSLDAARQALADASSPSPGPDTSNPYTDKNRRFWTDTHLEPKQQHRFTIEFPVYMPVGINRDTRVVAAGYTSPQRSASALQALKLKKKAIKAQVEGVEGATTCTLTGNGFDSWVADAATALADAYDDDNDDATAKALAIVKGVTGAPGTAPVSPDPLKVGPRGMNRPRYQSNSGMLYLRISDYIGYSFTPPGFGFTQGMLETSDGGVAVPDNSKNQYTLNDAKLTIVTTLSDDLHWSLNFLFAIAAASRAGAGSQGTKEGVKLFPSDVYAGNQSDKTMKIVEWSARNDPHARGPAAGKYKKDLAAHRPNPNPGAFAVGIHKLVDPVIKAASFEPFTYGGTDLVKINLTLGYGPETGMMDFYSYQNTRSRYSDYFTWDDEVKGQYANKRGYAAKTLEESRRNIITKYPEWFVNDPTRAAQEASLTDPAPFTTTEANPYAPHGENRSGPGFYGPDGQPGGGDDEMAVRDVYTNAKKNKYIKDTIRRAVQSGDYKKANALVSKNVLLSMKDADDARAAHQQRQSEQATRDAERSRASDSIRDANLAEETADRANRGTEQGQQVSSQDARAQEQRMIRTLRQGGASPAELRQARQNIRDQQSARRNQGPDSGDPLTDTIPGEGRPN